MCNDLSGVERSVLIVVLIIVMIMVLIMVLIIVSTIGVDTSVHDVGRIMIALAIVFIQHLCWRSGDECFAEYLSTTTTLLWSYVSQSISRHSDEQYIRTQQRLHIIMVAPPLLNLL